MPPQASLEGSQVALPALEPFRRLDQQQRAHILAQKMPIVWQQSDNVPFEQSRNVLLTTPAWGNVCWVKANYALGEFRLRLWGWKAERRFVVLRERVRESRHSVGRKLIDVPGYAFRVFVTSQTQAAEEVWRDYNRRADMENRIGELKHDLGADGFCMQKFFATEAAFRTVLLVFNLLAEFQRAAGLPGYREPATLRTQVLDLWSHPRPCRPPPGPSSIGKLGRLENPNGVTGQHLALEDPNFAGVGSRHRYLILFSGSASCQFNI
jgi:hypothetical protein